MLDKRFISRRDFLRLSAISATAGILAACAPKETPVPEPAEPAEEPEPTEAAAEEPAEEEPTEAPAPEPVTISYWHIWGGARTEQLQVVVDDFMAETPEIIVEPLLLPNPGYQDKIITGLAGDAPDLTMIYTDEFAPSAKRGALVSVDDFMAADGITPDIWYDGQWAMTQWDGKAYGLPFVGNFLSMLYWNRDDLEAAGLDPEAGPETWDEMVAMAEALTVFDDDGNVENLGYVPGGMGEWMGGTYRNGADWFGNGTPDGDALDSAESLEALKYAVSLYEAQGGWDAVGGATEAWGNQQLGNPMIAGVASIILSGIFTVNIINDQAPDLNYKIGKVPHGPNGEFLDLTQAAWNNSIPAKAQNPEQAWEFAKYMSAGDGHEKFMVELQSRPAMVKAYNEAPYDAKAREGNPYWDEVLEILNGKAASLPVSDKIGEAKTLISEAFEGVMLEESTPEDAVVWAQEEVVAVFEED